MCIITQHRFVFKDTAGAACPEDKRFNIKLEQGRSYLYANTQLRTWK